jgi:hypothetical protein
MQQAEKTQLSILFLIITCLFITCLLITNVSAGRLIQFMGLPLTAEFIAYQDINSHLLLAGLDLKHSQEAVRWLTHWFKPAEDLELLTLKNQLLIMTANFKKKPHKRANIHEPINSIRLIKEPVFLH